MRYLPLTFLAILLCSCSLHAQTVSARVDRTTILIGEPITLDLQGIFTGVEARWPLIDSIAGFEILNKGSERSSRTDRGLSIMQQFTITAWDSGSKKIPSIIIGNAKTNPIPIRVNFSEMDPNQAYHDIKDIETVAAAPSSNWYWYVALAALLIALFLLFFPKSKPKDPSVFIPAEDAYKKARKKLKQLYPGSTQQSKEYFTELVNVFREYLHKRRNVQSFSKTTDDLVSQLGKLKLPVEEEKKLRDTLSLSDMVKFAQFQPSLAELQDAHSTIVESIDIIESIPHAV